jgi:transcriptional regulator with XRE-family HTH domain
LAWTPDGSLEECGDSAARRDAAMFDPAVIGPRDGSQRPRPLLRTMLGEVLRRTRLEQERTLADVARAARVSMPYLSEVERGRKEVSSEILAAICDALDVDLADLLADVGSDLADAQVRPAQVIRLGAITSRQTPDRAGSAGAGAGDAMCLLAA